MAVNTTRFPLRGAQPRSATTRRASATQHPQQPSDDEILGLVTAVARPSPDPSDQADGFATAPVAAFAPAYSAAQPAGAAANAGQFSAASTQDATQPDAQDPSVQTVVPPELAQVLDAHPQLRDAWDSAQQFRAVFATPVPAQSVAQPVAQQTVDPRRAAQLLFFHSTNSAAVHQVIGAIEAQVSHLLPQGVSAPTKTRIVGEIYRDLGTALRDNRQLGQQLRDAFRSGAGDAGHQQAIVSLVTGRAKQALPSIARRVIGEWTHSVVAANHERFARHDTSAKRVDISGAGSSDGVNRKPISPRDVDYKRLSDADILNL